ncbi:hypothetical protein SAMN05444392_101457 [Seinonella peptonophila]|uniref:Uncharacterized protein n=1 Tax=Seinonella peptonophila TaxID=112248 RepID=A0A1M4TH30_9BACL|nr:hypothetical protein [Seinonella peptonophila]SHE43587.1 hypothetical protein SAMN05444392_101457 [Seinonella peptonophila]
MREFLIDLLVIPATFILGRLSRSIHITGFHIRLQRKKDPAVMKSLQKG